MFSTILKEVTGYFDKRALISAFFPAMIFWGLTIIIVLLYWIGSKEALESWNKTSGTVQVLMLLGFFIWVAFWTFLTLNFHSLLLRVYEGHWPIEFIVRLRRRYWQRRWDALDQRDKELGIQATILSGEQLEFESLRELIEARNQPEQVDPKSSSDGKIDVALSVLRQELAALEQEIAKKHETPEHPFDFQKYRKTFSKRVLKNAEAGQPGPSIYEQLAALGNGTRKTWELYLKYVPAKDDVEPWKRRSEQLNDLSKALVQIGKDLGSDINQQILALHHEFFLMLPPYREEVVPTGLGNVLKAAESRVRLRYEMDAVLAWSRLEPLLPKEAAESLQNAKTSLDLMLTLSASLLAFGLPLSVWLMFQTTKWFRWWVPLILLVIALVVRLRIAAIPAAIALFVSLFPPVSNAGAQRFLCGTQVVLTAFAGLSLISWICYQNAVQSCLAYGEKIQSVFDLYRWKLLDELHLQLPPNLEEERKMWKEVGALLYRGYEPSSDYYQYVKDEKKTKAPVASQESASTAVKPLIPDALTGKDSLNKYVAVGLEVNQADVLGGKLVPGDHVDIIIISAYSLMPVKYEDILVLDVSVKNPESTAPQPVVVVVLSRAHQEDFILRTRLGNVTLTRRI